MTIVAEKPFLEPVAAHGHMTGWPAFRQVGMSEAKA